MNCCTILLKPNIISLVRSIQSLSQKVSCNSWRSQTNWAVFSRIGKSSYEPGSLLTNRAIFSRTGVWDGSVSNRLNLRHCHFILFTNPSARVGYDTRSIFKRSLTGLNSEFSFSQTSCLTKAEEPSLSYYLPIAGGRIIGFIPFPRVLVLCEMQSVSSRIWTRVAVLISSDDNHYTTGTSTAIL